MDYIAQAKELTGYRVKVIQRPAFQVTGYTLIVPPGKVESIPRFWDEITSDGRLSALKKASSVPTWVLGLGSWDPECEKHGHRYTICIEITQDTDFSELSQKYPLFTKQIGASDWMCFELTHAIYFERFWQDNPYQMMKKLGYLFNSGDFSIGLHFDAYPPGFDPILKQDMEFWITVKKHERH